MSVAEGIGGSLVGRKQVLDVATWHGKDLQMSFSKTASPPPMSSFERAKRKGTGVNVTWRWVMCVGGVEIYIKGKGGTTKVKNQSFLRVFADLPFDVHLGVYILFSIVTKSSPQQVKIPTRLLQKPPLARPKKGGAWQAKGRTKPRISIFRGGSAEGLRKTTSISHLM